MHGRVLDSDLDQEFERFRSEDCMRLYFCKNCMCSNYVGLSGTRECYRGLCVIGSILFMGCGPSDHKDSFLLLMVFSG